ncbi:MAG: hypothetical protein ABFR82_09125 [Nitrospirota bacterium]
MHSQFCPWISPGRIEGNLAHIYRKLLTVLLFIILTGSFQNTAYAEKVRHTDTKKHFLWSVESKHNTIYLLGSIHKGAYPLAEEIES